MWLDETLELCDNVDFHNITNSTANIGDVIDLDENNRRIGSSNPLMLVVTFAERMVGGTSVQFLLRRGNNLSGGNLGSSGMVEVVRSEAILTANANLNSWVILPFPSGNLVTERRYLQLAANVVGNPNAGAVNAFLTVDAYDWVAKKFQPVQRV